MTAQHCGRATVSSAERNSIGRLPNELLQHVLLYLPALSVAAFERVCRRFFGIVGAFNWRNLCQADFRYWHPSHKIQSKLDADRENVDWKEVFTQRYRSHRETTRLLNSILSTQVGRIDKFQQIVGIGYDAKDCLLEHLAVDEDAEDVLARRYYSDAALGCLHRAIAVEEWSRLQRRESLPLERVLAAFDMFVLHDRKGDLAESTTRLDALAAEVLERYPDFNGKTTREKATSLATFLLQHKRTGLRESDAYHYHDVQNNFIGFTLHEDDHASIPLICVAIYCSVATRLGLNANPCALPFHVVAVVRPEPGIDCNGKPVSPEHSADSVYMDPFETDEEISLGSLLSRLSLVGTLPADHGAFLENTLVPDLVIRTAHNILYSVQESLRRRSLGQVEGQMDVTALPISDFEGAFYGALWASLLLGIPANGDGPVLATIRPRAYLPPFVDRFETLFPMDVSLIEQYIIPMFQHTPEFAQLRESVRVVRNVDSMPKQVKRRTTRVSERVRYRVGQVFQHKRYSYLAVIIGWDTECFADEQWQDQMRIHELSRGAGQSFYHALVEDKSVRYVAEENIDIVKPEMPHGLISLAGKHFKRWDKQSRSFISNIRDEYPDD